MFKKIISKNLLNFFALASALALGVAYIAEYVFDFQPCILCLYQRIPFFAIIVIALFANFTKNKILRKASLLLVLALVLTNIAIAFYQVGVEQKFFHGPDKCSASNLEGIENLEELKAAIMATKPVRCDEPSFFFLSLSMAAWNFIYCLALFLLGVFFLKNRK